MANKFKLKDKVGIHVEGSRTYKAGEVIVSNRNLAKLFPHKFEDLGPAPKELEPPTSAQSKRRKPSPAKDVDWDDEKGAGK